MARSKLDTSILSQLCYHCCVCHPPMGIQHELQRWSLIKHSTQKKKANNIVELVRRTVLQKHLELHSIVHHLQYCSGPISSCAKVIFFFSRRCVITSTQLFLPSHSCFPMHQFVLQILMDLRFSRARMCLLLLMAPLQQSYQKAADRTLMIQSPLISNLRFREPVRSPYPRQFLYNFFQSG